GVECSDVPAPGSGRACGRCPEGLRGDGAHCELCRLRVSIQYTTAVEGKVTRAGWHRSERELIGGRNDGLDNATCTYAEGVRLWWTAATSNGTFPLDAATNKADSLTLNVPKEALTVGVSYMFRLSAALSGNREVFASASATFFVESQPLVVVVSGGGVTTGSDTPIVLDAGSSLDPDGEADEMSFEWRCARSDGLDECRSADGARLPAVMEGSVVALRLQGAEQGLNYTFTVLGKKGSRRSQVSTQLRINGGSMPSLVIEPLLDKLNVAQKLRLRSSVASVSVTTLTYEWTLVPSESSHPLDLDSAISSIDRFQPDLILEENTLAPGGTYTFRLTARDAAGSATARVSVEVNQSPAGGRVSAGPSDGSDAGAAYTDLFDFRTSGWLDTDLPLLYQFSYHVVGEVGEFALNEFAPPAVYTSVFPAAGLPAHDHIITVLATARDSAGASSQASLNLTVLPPFDPAEDAAAAVSLASSLSTTADQALLDGDVDATLVLVDSAVSLISLEGSAGGTGPATSGNATEPQRGGIRTEAVRLLAHARGAVFSTGSMIQRFAQSTLAATGVPAELTADAQEEALRLVEGLIQDTRADPAASPLSGEAASAICGSLAALNAAPQRANSTAMRASKVAATMGRMKASMLEGAAPGERPAEVAASGLAMTVARSDASSSSSRLYTSPLTTDGAAVAFPSALMAAAGARDSTALPPPPSGAGSNCSLYGASSQEACAFETSPKVVLDSQLMTSAADPHLGAGATGDEARDVQGMVTTISLSFAEGSEEEEDLAVTGLDEAVTFSLQLLAVGPDSSLEGRGAHGHVLCTFWNATLATYSTAGCAALPNPAPPGAMLHWRTLAVAELPGPLDSAWAIGNSFLLEGCVESFDAHPWLYEGADAGLRKYLPNATAGLPAGGPAEVCELSTPENRFGCWWNWTHQIFSGPDCVISAAQECYCTHLTDFKAEQAMEVESQEPPQVNTLRADQFRLSPEDIINSGALLALVASIIGVASYLAMCSATAHNEVRATLLRKLALPHGTGEYSFQFRGDGAWTWSLFCEDTLPSVAKLTLRAQRCDRLAERTARLERLGSHLRRLESGPGAARDRKAWFFTKKAKGAPGVTPPQSARQELKYEELAQELTLECRREAGGVFPTPREEFAIHIVPRKKRTRAQRLQALGADLHAPHLETGGKADGRADGSGRADGRADGSGKADGRADGKTGAAATVWASSSLNEEEEENGESWPQGAGLQNVAGLADVDSVVLKPEPERGVSGACAVMEETEQGVHGGSEGNPWNAADAGMVVMASHTAMQAINTAGTLDNPVPWEALLLGWDLNLALEDTILPEVDQQRLATSQKQPRVRVARAQGPGGSRRGGETNTAHTAHRRRHEEASPLAAEPAKPQQPSNYVFQTAEGHSEPGARGRAPADVLSVMRGEGTALLRAPSVDKARNRQMRKRADKAYMDQDRKLTERIRDTLAKNHSLLSPRGRAHGADPSVSSDPATQTTQRRTTADHKATLPKTLRKPKAPQRTALSSDSAPSKGAGRGAEQPTPPVVLEALKVFELQMQSHSSEVEEKRKVAEEKSSSSYTIGGINLFGSFREVARTKYRTGLGSRGPAEPAEPGASDLVAHTPEDPHMLQLRDVPNITSIPSTNAVDRGYRDGPSRGRAAITRWEAHGAMADAQARRDSLPAASDTALVESDAVPIVGGIAPGTSDAPSGAIDTPPGTSDARSEMSDRPRDAELKSELDELPEHGGEGEYDVNGADTTMDGEILKRLKRLERHREKAVKVVRRLRPFLGHDRAVAIAASYIKHCKGDMRPVHGASHVSAVPKVFSRKQLRLRLRV
ncbi:hypothetical protein CYMTET_7638, partial [Cymbomonas tetramitiformis]